MLIYVILKTPNYSDLKLAYDSMFGAGKNVVSRLLPDALQIHSDDNPGFHGQAPEPIHRNLLEFSDLIKSILLLRKIKKLRLLQKQSKQHPKIKKRLLQV